MWGAVVIRIGAFSVYDTIVKFKNLGTLLLIISGFYMNTPNLDHATEACFLRKEEALASREIVSVVRVPVSTDQKIGAFCSSF